eukprot:scaffold118670_cov37-Cyclotella_meneghiniana.AAC.4
MDKISSSQSLPAHSNDSGQSPSRPYCCSCHCSPPLSTSTAATPSGSGHLSGMVHIVHEHGVLTSTHKTCFPTIEAAMKENEKEEARAAR